jgi:hypothetical protein
VKVCSAYGAGFYYIPGTDICLRVGGYVWSEFEFNDFGAAPTFGAGSIGGDFVRNRNDNNTSYRVRFDAIMDARTNTEYGTVRSYASVGWQWTSNLDGFQQLQVPASAGNYAWYYDRAFIQFAGFTFGYVGSFFDFDPSMILNQQAAKSFKFTPAVAYTAQLGSGISASISMEDSTTRRLGINTAINSVQSGTVFLGGYGYFAPFAAVAGGCTGGNVTNGYCGNFAVPIGINQSGWGATLYAGQAMPDFVANVRVDQAWGDAQISGAVHQLRTIVNNFQLPFADGSGLTVPAGSVYAPDKYGYAVLGGVNFKLPMIAPGDSFMVEGAWSRGVVDYTGVSGNPYSSNLALGYRNGFYGPVVNFMDAYLNANGLNLSTAWSIDAQFRHFWTPTLRSTIAYGYQQYNAPGAAQNGANAQGVVATNAPNGFIANFPSEKSQQVTANLIWSPVKNLDLGLEGYWVQMKTDCAGLSSANCGDIREATRGKTISTEGGLFRARRDF